MHFSSGMRGHLGKRLGVFNIKTFHFIGSEEFSTKSALGLLHNEILHFRGDILQMLVELEEKYMFQNEGYVAFGI